MVNSFISVVGFIQRSNDLSILRQYLSNVHDTLARNFTDFEIILVNPLKDADPSPYIQELSPEIKQHVFLLELSGPTIRNHAILAGLDRSNGDYVILFEMAFFNHPQYILELFEKAKEKYDIVYLRSTSKKSWSYRLFYNVFYFILRNYSNLKIDAQALDSRIISRRALNSLLRLRENLRYMKALYSLVGYNTANIDVSPSIQITDEESFAEKFRNALIAITSYTSFLRTMLLWIFLFSLFFLIAVVYNAIKVKMTGEDIFGNIGQAVPGWAFLVLLISVFFAVMCLNLYIMSIYLSNIFEETKQRPLYIIESIKRF